MKPKIMRKPCTLEMRENENYPAYALFKIKTLN